MGAGTAMGALAALLGVAVAAHEPEAAPSEPSIAIVEFPHGARFIELPARCPGEPSEPVEAVGEFICVDALFGGRVRVNRHLSGPRIPSGTQVRFMAHHWDSWRGQRLLVAAVPFRDGKERSLLAYYVAPPAAEEIYCLPTSSLAEWDDDHVRRVFESGFRRRLRPMHWTEPDDFRCIRERRTLLDR
jgi:hypothetical protein